MGSGASTGPLPAGKDEFCTIYIYISLLGCTFFFPASFSSLTVSVSSRLECFGARVVGVTAGREKEAILNLPFDYVSTRCSVDIGCSTGISDGHPTYAIDP